MCIYKRLLPRESDFVRESRWIFFTHSCRRSTKSTCCCGRFRVIWNNQQQQQTLIIPDAFSIRDIKTKKKSIHPLVAPSVLEAAGAFCDNERCCVSTRAGRGTCRGAMISVSRKRLLLLRDARQKTPTRPTNGCAGSVPARTQSRVACNHVLQNLSDRE
jgi:hypothetical protein